VCVCVCELYKERSKASYLGYLLYRQRWVYSLVRGPHLEAVFRLPWSYICLNYLPSACLGLSPDLGGWPWIDLDLVGYFSLDSIAKSVLCERYQFGIDLKELGVRVLKCRFVWNFAQGLKFKTDFHSKKWESVDTNWDGWIPPTLSPHWLSDQLESHLRCCGQHTSDWTNNPVQQTQQFVIYLFIHLFYCWPSVCLCWTLNVIQTCVLCVQCKVSRFCSLHIFSRSLIVLMLRICSLTHSFQFQKC